MDHRSNPEPGDMLSTVRASFLMLMFGLGILTFLVAIDRPEWFHIRPASGTAAAMANAAARPVSADLR
jgi:hypothetical protein